MTLTLYVLKTISNALVEPTSFMILVFIGIMLYIQNRKITLMQRKATGKSLNSPLELTLSQIVMGIFGAILASLMMAYVGITFNENSRIGLIFILSIILMLIKPRLICFSYSGAILGFLSLLFKELSIVLNNPSLDILKIDIISLMYVIAILHFVEGIMIILDGSRGSIPIFTIRKGKLSGGFSLKRYWVLPLAIFFMLSSNSLNGITLNIPKYWGMFNSKFSLNVLKSIAIGAVTVYGVIGYEAVTFTKTRKKKVISSGLWVILYSILLFLFTQMCGENKFAQLFLIIFAPLGHEIMIFVQKFIEYKNQSLYVSSKEGMMVLEVLPNSPAYNMGIKSGDLLMNINNKNIEGEKDILEVINNAPNYIQLKAKEISGEIKELKYNNLISTKKLGVVLVPKDMPKDAKVVKVKNKSFKDILEEVQKKRESK